MQQLWQPYVDMCEHLHTMSALEFAFYDTWWTVADTRKRIRKQQVKGSNPFAGSHLTPHKFLNESDMRAKLIDPAIHARR